MYRTILADPPWRNRGNGRARKHYKFMSTDQIATLPISDLTAPNCVLILWSTWAELQNALTVMKAWTFTYMTAFPWIKTHNQPTVNLFNRITAKIVYTTGFWIRGCSEPILIGWKGTRKPGPNQFCGLLAQRLHHSRKPDDIYHYAESFPGPYLELFARSTRPRWHVWGNEVQSDIDLTNFPISQSHSPAADCAGTN